MDVRLTYLTQSIKYLVLKVLPISDDRFFRSLLWKVPWTFFLIALLQMYLEEIRVYSTAV